MDWKYKHFIQQAVFKSSPSSLLEAARAVAVKWAGAMEDTSDGFVARGSIALHNSIATFRITPVPEGTRLAVELLVERASTWGYALFDVGEYYNGQIDKWFLSISKQLGSVQEQILVSKTTSGLRVQRGCLIGCLVDLIVGTCLVLLAILLDHMLFPQSTGMYENLLSTIASFIGFLAGITAFLFVLNPDAPVWKFITERLQRTQNKKRK